MDKYEPPFKLTENMLIAVGEISEIAGNFSIAKPSHAPTLRRINRIRTIQGTLAIEQNSLSVDQVTAVLDGKHVIAPPKEIAEVRNAYKAYEMLDDFDPYSIDSLLTAHGIMMRGLVDEAGTFRTGAVGVADKNGNILHVGTLPRYVPESIERLLDWVRRSKLPPIIKSSVFHFEFELIHPFADGNGRIGRLWHTLLLAEWNPLFAWLPVESVIHDRQDEYYKAINESNDAGESTLFIEFMLSAIRDALAQAVPFKEKQIGKSARNAESRRKFVLDHLAQNPYIMNSDVRAALGVSPATANRILAELHKNGTLRRIRIGKYVGYEMNN